MQIGNSNRVEIIQIKLKFKQKPKSIQQEIQQSTQQSTLNEYNINYFKKFRKLIQLLNSIIE